MQNSEEKKIEEALKKTESDTSETIKATKALLNPL